MTTEQSKRRLASQMNLMRAPAGEDLKGDDDASNRLPQKQVLKRGNMSKSATCMGKKGHASIAPDRGIALTQSSSPNRTPLGGRNSSMAAMRKAPESRLQSKPITPVDAAALNVPTSNK